jgi:hypothetical protein
MIKLSELPDDTEICVQYNEYDERFYPMTKGEFSQEYLSQKGSRYYSVDSVYICQKSVPTFDLDTVLEEIEEDECYDGFAGAVMDELDENIVKKFIEHINEVFERHPTYWKEEQVEIDI